MRFDVLSEDGSDRPSLDEEVILQEDAVTIFGGEIQTLDEKAFGGQVDYPVTIGVDVADFHVLATRRYVNETIPAGTLKAALQVIVTYLPGATLDAGQVDGPALEELVFSDVKVEEVLNYLTSITNGAYVWKVSPTKVLSMTENGTVPAPFNITSATETIQSVTVKPMRQGYANRVIVRNSTSRVTAEDAGAIATYGEWELAVSAPDATSEDTLQALADAMLAQSLPILKELRYVTYAAGLEPGQTQTINLPSRNVNNTFLITEVVTRDAGLEFLLHDVTAVEGLVYRTGWRETYRQWGSGTGMSSVGGGGGGGSATRFAYFLGGSGVEAVRSATPTWVPVSGGPALGAGAVQVQINTVPRGSTAATVNVRLRAMDAGVTVQARLYDVTDGAPCPGVSAVVTNTDWEFVSFGVTLTPGSHIYELQLLPGTANADVQGVGYLE